MHNERKVVELNLSDVLPNRFQPRIKFDENAINELALSIQKYGVIQPIVVRQIGNKYEIIAGERRYKASKVAGKQTIPAIISELNDKDSVEIALIENVQREDLTPIEKAVSYKKILDMGYINQEELAKKVGKSQSAIANTLRLLNLSDDVQEALLENKISERHARSLLKIKDENKQVEMLNRIINERLTVRKTDEEIDKMNNNISEVNNVPDTFKPEEVVQIPDNATVAPGFMNIDAIENNAQDIIKPEKPVVNMEQLLQTNEPKQEPQHVEPTGKFFNFFDQPIEQPKQNDTFNFENFFNNMDNSVNNNSTTPAFEAPTIPDTSVMPSASVEPSIPTGFEAPNASVESSMPTGFEVPSAPVEPSIPTGFEAPSAPAEPSIPTGFEAPSAPAEPSMPTGFEVPSAPAEPSMPTGFEVPSAPAESSMPTGFEVPSAPAEPSMPTGFEVPSAPAEPSMPTGFEVSSAPAEPSMPTGFEVPSAPAEPSMPTGFEVPSAPAEPSMPTGFEVSSASEIPTTSTETTGVSETPIYDVPIAPSTDSIPVIDQPIEPSTNIGNTSVETFNAPASNISEPTANSTIKAAVPNMRVALNTIRECENTLEKYGFNVDVEEIDFEDSYQVIFKIEK